MTESIRQNLLDIIKSCDTVQFCTMTLDSYPETRTIINMANKEKKDIKNMNLYFFTRISSNKSKQVQNNKNTSLYYFNPNTRRAITLFGESKILTDKKTKSSFWSDELKKFGYSSIDDESYCIIEFTPKAYKFFLNGTDEQRGNV